MVQHQSSSRSLFVSLRCCLRPWRRPLCSSKIFIVVVKTVLPLSPIQVCHRVPRIPRRVYLPLACLLFTTQALNNTAKLHVPPYADRQPCSSPQGCCFEWAAHFPAIPFLRISTSYPHHCPYCVTEWHGLDINESRGRESCGGQNHKSEICNALYSLQSSVNVHSLLLLPQP